MKEELKKALSDKPLDFIQLTKETLESNYKKKIEEVSNHVFKEQKQKESQSEE